MARKLQQYLLDRYTGGRSCFILVGETNVKKKNKAELIQIDDQDDGDALTEFCNVYCAVTSAHEIRLELYGKFPVTRELYDLARSHGGFVDRKHGRLVMNIQIDATQAIDELARHVKATAGMGAVAGNPAWMRVSARTVSTLSRLSRVLRDYMSENVGEDTVAISTALVASKLADDPAGKEGKKRRR